MSDAEPTHPVPEQRALARSVWIGIAVGVGSAAIAFFLIAIPFYTLASFEPNGLDRPVVRTGLFRIALPVGALIGLVVGVVAGRVYRSGRSWTTGGDEDRFSAR